MKIQFFFSIVNHVYFINRVVVSRRYADEHLLTEIQDPRSDDELDVSGV